MKCLGCLRNPNLFLAYSIFPYFTSTTKNILVCFIAVVSFTGSVIDGRPVFDRFDEELLIKPMASGHVYTYFQFTTIWNVSGDTTSEAFHHCHLFPRALGELVGRHSAQEFHLSLTSGIWRYEKWGYPVYDASPGAEIWAWFKNDTEDIDSVWKRLTNTLSGLLCASLNFIDSSNSFSPQFSFRPTGTIKDLNINSSFVRYATLPREVVCTENLTPWKKLLPCDSVRGLASLLNAGHIYNTNYHSLGLHMRPICQDKYCTLSAVEIRQVVSLVFDLKTLDSQNDDWSLRKLFGLGLGGPCPLATISNIYVDISGNKTGAFFRLQPLATEYLKNVQGDPERELWLYDIKQMNTGHMINIALSHHLPKPFVPLSKTALYAKRFLVGLGQERGVVVTKVFNNHWNSLDVLFLDNIPWFLSVYFHTLRITCNGKEIVPVLKKIMPGKEHARPYFLEVLFRVPPRSVTEIQIQFDYVFLKWQEYPPDANHGFYIGSAVLTAQLAIGKEIMSVSQGRSTLFSSLNTTKDNIVQIRTDMLIITLPTPDFSMPYNVICLACTVVALAFGPLHNITTKRLCLRDIDSSKGLLTWIKSRLRGSKKTEEKQD